MEHGRHSDMTRCGKGFDRREIVPLGISFNWRAGFVRIPGFAEESRYYFPHFDIRRLCKSFRHGSWIRRIEP